MRQRVHGANGGENLSSTSASWSSARAPRTYAPSQSFLRRSSPRSLVSSTRPAELARSISASSPRSFEYAVSTPTRRIRRASAPRCTSSRNLGTGSGCGRLTASTRTRSPARGWYDGRAGRSLTRREPTSVSGTPADSTTCPSEDVPSVAIRTVPARFAGARNMRSSATNLSSTGRFGGRCVPFIPSECPRRAGTEAYGARGRCDISCSCE